MSDILNPPRGMRDIYGELAEAYEQIFDVFRKYARKWGFEPIITPTVEHFALFAAKSGEEIRNSMYTFQDKAGRQLALRPEVTASVVRAYLRGLKASPKPLRLYYIAQCFRYEEPQRARYREFWQAGLEVIGDPDPNADILVAYTASSALEELGVDHYYVVGNVSLYRGLMSSLGVPGELQDHVLHLIDKGLVDEALSELRGVVGEGADIISEALSAGEGDVEKLIEERRGLLGDRYEQVLGEHRRVVAFIDALRDLGLRAVYEPKLVRGLAYYTGLIFEYKTAQLDVSIGGGGRYDGLTTVYGGPFEYSTGLALGVDRIALTISGRAAPQRGEAYIVITFGGVPYGLAYRVARSLIKRGNAVVVLRPKSLSKALEYANKMGYSKAVIIGDKEYSEGVAIVKDLIRREQEVVKLSELTSYSSR